ncbi:MAG: ammonium transporter, Amt family [Solirubrobacteraceae bacterium]|jgi:Amt family ammonium transporter|nr:ammonium transporter, Amt family [Solirubrobacteraceae bacterium]
MPPFTPYPPWLSPGDNAWQLTAATLVGLMSVPGLVVLYGGVMQKRWAINSMMLTFGTFSVVLVVWVLWGFKLGFGHPIGHGTGFFSTFWGKPGIHPVLNQAEEQGRANIPLLSGAVPNFRFPMSSLVYFQFVFAAITPILALGSVLGRVNIKAWLPFCALWITFVYTIDAFLLWGGGFFAHKGALDFSGGYVIHLSAGITGFVAAAVIGPRLQRDREIDAPNNVLMVATGAGLLWLGWNGFNGGDPYFAGTASSAAVLNTNLCTAVAFLVWVVWDYATGRKPSLIGGVNGMIVGLVAITPAAGYVNGFGAIAMGAIASTLVYFALNYLSRMRPFRNVDDTLGVIYTHGFAGFAGGLLTGVFADPSMIGAYGPTGTTKGDVTSFAGVIHGNWTLLKWQFLAGAFVIIFSGVMTFVILKLVGVFIPLRMKEENMEIGDTAEHGHEVYPSDVPSLGFPGGVPGLATGAAGAAPSTA